MTVYLLHLSSPLSQGVSPAGRAMKAQHYIGWSKQVNKRLAHHQHGSGARFTQVAVQRGISFEVVRIWEGATRTFERHLKDQHNARLLCPLCNPNAMRRAVVQ